MTNSNPQTPFALLEEERPAEYFELETPFLGTHFAAETWAGQEVPAPQLEGTPTTQVETPFLAEYHGEAPVNLEGQALEQTLMELFDSEFNEAVATLANEASAQAENFAGINAEGAQQMLTEWLDPLRKATERLFEQAGEASTQQQLESLSDNELESFLENLAPGPGAVAPEFEEFFGKVWRKVKSIARTAINIAKKGVGALAKLALPIGVLFKKLAQLVKPLLNRVIRFALGKLPSELQPIATILGRRLGILKEALESEAADREAATTPEAEGIAQEFDVAVATLLFARDEGETEQFLQETAQEASPYSETSPVAELDAARERFVAQFAHLQPGESAAPVVQQFLPAILPLLRVGITVVGRQRVVKFLAGYLAKLIQRYVGPEAANALSQALVSVGLRMITLETEQEASPQVAARAVAATLEDAVRRVAGFGFEHFNELESNREQQQLLESIATEAFFESTMVHFPAQLLDAQRLEDREMYFETSPASRGVWAYRPRPRYKKFTTIFERTITRPIAAQLRSFGGEPLVAFFRARGVRLPLTARIHLYEAIPGTTLSRVALLERKTPGLGSGTEAAFSKIHPLDVRSAGLLLGEPGLGRDIDPRFTESRNRIAAGQRFYYVEIAQRGAGPKTPGSQTNVTVDLRASQVRVNVYFSEADAQRVVAAGPTAGPMTAARIAQGVVSGAINSIRTGPSRHVTLIREATGELEGEDFWQRIAGAAAEKVVQWLLEELAKALLIAVKAAVIRYFNTRLTEFATATRHPAQGVTLVLVFNHPGLRLLHAALAGRVPNMSDVRAAARALRFNSIVIVPGFTRR